MKNIKSFLFIFFAMMIAMACNNQGFKKTRSGLLYKIISDGKGEVAKRGQFLKINFVQKVHDSVLNSSTDGMPVYTPVDSTGPNYSAAEIFPLLRKGDSAVIILLADSLQRKSGQPLPPFIKKKDKLTLALKVIDIFPSQELVRKDEDSEIQKQRLKEIKVVEDYLFKNKITTQKTQKGTYVEVKARGDGPAVDSGKEISVRYTGKAIPSGKVFESNMNGPNTEPYKFVVGRRQIIPGWDDGLRLFKKGGKGTLYIPAFLAYDSRQGPGGKQYENLIFDVEIVDVKDAPNQPAANAMPSRGLPQKIDSQTKKSNPQ
ncbi:MAG TPA: FKBP-type peptidyl-prolyl cis-trans isomerase, partial [Puia sp.]|nr:FKBP-type peptidyl-prolyl cis-trans isomerase [Puia sp.]